MANIILAVPLSDTADLTGSAGPATMPVSNLQTKQPSESYRILSPASAFINIDMGAAQPLDLIALISHTGSTRASVRVRAAATFADVEADPAYDSGLLPMRSHQEDYDTDDTTGSVALNNFILKLDTPESLRYWRIDIADSVSSFIDIGRLYMAKAFSPEINIDYGCMIGFSDLSRLPRASGGMMIPLRKQKFRYAEFAVTFLSEAEAFNYIFEFDRLRGATEDVLFIKDISNRAQLQRTSIYGLISGLQPISHANFQLFAKTYRIEEL